MPELLDDELLERSSVVANSTMNRERGLAGGNSYARELGIDPLGFLIGRLRQRERVSWLDLCCGTGKALIEAAGQLRAAGLAARVSLVGVDLVSAFLPHSAEGSCLRLVAAPLPGWEPEERFDLVTCVHGLHYVGDKLGLVCLAAGWLEEDGLLLAHLDPANVRLTEGQPAGRAALRMVRGRGFEYDPRRHILQSRGRKSVPLPWRYLGADDQAGPNYTGQPAVNSYYDDERI